MKTQKFGPFLGINNRLPAHSLRVATSRLNGQYLRDALNVDIDNAGKIVRRRATALAHADTGAHSIHMVSDTDGYMVRASKLYRITMPTYAEVEIAILSSNNPMSYAKLAGRLYASNGVDQLCIEGSDVLPYGLPTPSAPSCATAPAGTLPAGIYKIAISFYNIVTGEESGVSPATHFTAAANTNITVTLPGCPYGAGHVRVYVSTPNGTVPLHHTTVANGPTSFVVTSPGSGWEARETFEDVLPAGRLFTSNGKLCSIVGSIVYVGVPYRPGYHVPSESYLPFPSAVSIAIENQGGTYIAADKTYFFPGDLMFSETTVADVLPYGAVPGTEFQDTENSTVGWFGQKGFVIASTNGEVEAVMTENIDLTPPASGYSVILEGAGYKHVVGCGWSLNLENKAATRCDWSFNSASGKFGAAADGIHALESVGEVDTVVDFGQIDLSVENLKHIPHVYLGVDSDEPMTLEVRTPKGVSYEYEGRRYDAGLKNQRFDLGKGLRETWFEFFLRNNEGADFSISTMSLLPTVSARRI